MMLTGELIVDCWITVEYYDRRSWHERNSLSISFCSTDKIRPVGCFRQSVAILRRGIHQYYRSVLADGALSMPLESVGKEERTKNDIGE